MRWTGLLALLLLLPACASSRPSDETGPLSREGAYLQIGAMKSMEFFGPAAPLGNETDGDVGGAIRLGWRGATNIAVEVFAENARGFDLDSSSGPTDNTVLELRSFGVQAKFFLGGDRVEPYLLFGGGRASAHFSDGSFTRPSLPPVQVPDADNNESAFGRGGLGCEFHFTESFGAFLEANYNYMFGRMRDYDHLDAIAGIVISF